MSRLDDIKGAYDNIQVPVELKERVLQNRQKKKHIIFIKQLQI